MDWLSDPTKLTVVGLLAAFIGALLSTKFYTPRHVEDIIKGWEKREEAMLERCKRAEQDAIFWRDYALRADEKQVQVIATQEQQLKLIAALHGVKKLEGGQ